MIMMEEEFNPNTIDEYGNSLEDDDIQIYVHEPNRFEKFLMRICKFFKRLFEKCRRKN
jgi:hypothetical protein